MPTIIALMHRYSSQGAFYCSLLAMALPAAATLTAPPRIDNPTQPTSVAAKHAAQATLPPNYRLDTKPDAMLGVIRQLVADGRNAEARLLLRRLQLRWPHYALPADIEKWAKGAAPLPTDR